MRENKDWDRALVRVEKISDLVFDWSLYPRKEVDHKEVVRTYARALQAGCVFPPVKVGVLAGKKIIVDGVHRVSSRKLLDVDYVDCAILPFNSKAELFAEAVRLNSIHGNARARAPRNFIFLILKLENKDAFAVGIAERKNPERRSLALFTGDEFSSFLSEIVKYCLDLPKVARSIPCPIDLTKVYHGLLKIMKAKVRRKGDDVLVDVKWEPRLLEYHGVKPNEWELYDPESEHAALAMRPIRSKALKERRITEFRIAGRNQAIKIQARKNPALKVRMTMKKSMLDAIDKALDIGLHINRQEFIADAIRAKLNKLGMNHDIS